MTREQLKALGLTEEQIDSIMGMHGKATQGLQAQLATQNAILIKAQADLKTLQEQAKDKPKDEPTPEVSPEMKALQDQIAQLQADNRLKDLRAYASDNKITGEQADAIINAFGDDLEIGKSAIDSIAKMIASTAENVKLETEKSLLKGTPNPQGGQGGEDKTPEDVKNAQSITFAKVDKDAQSARDFYK